MSFLRSRAFAAGNSIFHVSFVIRRFSEPSATAVGAATIETQVNSTDERGRGRAWRVHFREPPQPRPLAPLPISLAITAPNDRTS